MQHLCPHPHFKLLQAIAVPEMAADHEAFANFRWEALLNTLRAMHVANSPCEEVGGEEGRGIWTNLTLAPEIAHQSRASTGG